MSTGKGKPGKALVLVVVSHDHLIRGESGEMDLTDRVLALIDKGYLRIVHESEPGVGDLALGATLSRGDEGGPALLGVDSQAGARDLAARTAT